jgi:hypothetical protein
MLSLFIYVSRTMKYSAYIYIYIYMKKCSVTSCAMQHLQCDMSGNSIKFTRARWQTYKRCYNLFIYVSRTMKYRVLIYIYENIRF